MTRPWVLAILAAAAIAVGLQNFLYFRSGAAPQGSEASGDSASEFSDLLADGAGSEVAAPLPRRRLLEYLAALPGDDRNPFLTRSEAEQIRTGSAGSSSGLPVLSGILWSPTLRVAWLDDEPRLEHDRVGPLRLDEIRPGAVVLSREQGDDLLLRLPERSLRASAAAADEEAEGEADAVE